MNHEFGSDSEERLGRLSDLDFCDSWVWDWRKKLGMKMGQMNFWGYDKLGYDKFNPTHFHSVPPSFTHIIATSKPQFLFWFILYNCSNGVYCVIYSDCGFVNYLPPFILVIAHIQINVLYYFIFFRFFSFCIFCCWRCLLLLFV